MNDENEEQTGTKETLKGIGQTIIGEIEIIGGILTGDPITQAEGEFNAETGTLRIETTEEIYESEETNSEKSKPTE